MTTPVSHTEGTADFGNTLDTAFAIAPIAVVTGRIGPGDAGDMFRIDLPDTGRISLRLDGLSGRLDLAYFDRAGTILGSSWDWSTAPKNLEFLMPDRTWYVRVSPTTNAVSDYRLSVITTGPVEGTSGDDSLTGGVGLDTLYGMDGDDTLVGLDNRDLLVGGSGNDRLDGGDWHDQLYGGLGDDTLLGGNGNDELYGGAGDDWLETGAGSVGSWFREKAWGGSGNDTVIGGSSDNRVNHTTHVGGGAGNDLIDLRGPGWFWAYGGDGDDTLQASDGPGTGTPGLNNLWGGQGNDQIRGGVQADRLYGGAGNDTLTGQDGNDTLEGGGGNDVLDGGVGNDVLRGGAGFDRLTGGAGADRFEFDRNQNWNRIEDFSIADGDVLVLKQFLWQADYGLLRPQQVVDLFGRIGTAGDVVLGFGSIGTQVRLVGVTTLDGLEDALLLV